MTSKGARIMRKGVFLIGLMAAIAFAAGTAWAAASPTPSSIPFPLKGAKLFKASFAHALTPCDPETGVTLHIAGPTKGGKRDMIGCQAVIPDTTGYDTAQISVNSKSLKYVLTGKGFAVPKVTLQMHVITTMPSNAVGMPAIWETPGTYDVTFLPLHLLCAPATIDPKGKLVQKGNLDQCVRNATSPAWNLLQPKSEIVPQCDTPPCKDMKPPTLNIQVVDAEIGTTTKCLGGSKDGNACVTACTSPTLCVNGDNICIGAGQCVGLVCVGGSRDTQLCAEDADCPVDQSTCDLTPFGVAGLVR